MFVMFELILFISLLTIVFCYTFLKLASISRRLDREMENSTKEFNQALDEMVRNYHIHCSMECAENNGCEKCTGK